MQSTRKCLTNSKTLKFEVGSDPLSEDLFGMNEELIREIREKDLINPLRKL